MYRRLLRGRRVLACVPPAWEHNSRRSKRHEWRRLLILPRCPIATTSQNHLFPRASERLDWRLASVSVYVCVRALYSQSVHLGPLLFPSIPDTPSLLCSGRFVSDFRLRGKRLWHQPQQQQRQQRQPGTTTHAHCRSIPIYPCNWRTGWWWCKSSNTQQCVKVVGEEKVDSDHFGWSLPPWLLSSIIVELSCTAWQMGTSTSHSSPS